MISRAPHADSSAMTTNMGSTNRLRASARIGVSTADRSGVDVVACTCVTVGGGVVGVVRACPLVAGEGPDGAGPEAIGGAPGVAEGAAGAGALAVAAAGPDAGAGADAGGSGVSSRIVVAAATA